MGSVFIMVTVENEGNSMLFFQSVQNITEILPTLIKISN